MRRPTFAGWIRRLILNLAHTDSFNLRKFAASAQKDTPRLVEPLLLYAYDSCRTERLLDYIWNEEIQTSYEIALRALDGKDLTTRALFERDTNGLPYEYEKHLNSFRIAYHKLNTINASKKMRWERSRTLQREKGISAAEIYRALKLNPGNVNAYLKHGSLDKVSLENATRIMNYLYEH
jgi:hypothetical protein